MFEVLDAPSPMQDKPDALELARPAGPNRIPRREFRYPLSTETIIPVARDTESTISDENDEPTIKDLECLDRAGATRRTHWAEWGG